MHCCSSEPIALVRVFLRISLGLSLLFIGLTHVADPEFATQTGAGLHMLEPLGYVWGLVLPGFMIVGGILLAFGVLLPVAALTAGIALASIPVGLLLKSALGSLPLEAALPAALNAIIWLLALAFALCSHRCAAPVPVARPTVVPPPPPPPAPVPSAPVASVARPPVAPVKKAPAKKKAAPKKPAVKKESPPSPPAEPKGGLDL
jgi:hypothetical protein